MVALLHDEALRRASLITVTSYEIELDLSRGEEEFASRTVLRFACAEPGASSFADLKAVAVHGVRLNGRELPPEAVADERVALDDLRAHNELVVDATMRFSRDGQGLHRAVDPEDGRPYVYGHMFLDAAPRVYACFDQPDMKAPYDVRVTVPAGWAALGNGAATLEAPCRGDRDTNTWRLATTQPLATYFVTICAGPYATVTAQHDGITLGLHVRASLGDRLREQAPELLDITRAGLDHYHALYGIRYPFGEYHQVFVPEFNAGAMENPGCVTFRDTMIFRGEASAAQKLSRANTVLHEMAHMWFGDLVTMRWWDDLWLNESFAEFMATRACAEVTPQLGDAWADFTIFRKTWGYGAERSPSTHPVAGNPPTDAPSALHNFDGISYAKGATVLAQLTDYVGQGAFDAGVRRYLGEHAYGNATLHDFLGAVEAESGRDLTAWAQAWLRTARLDELSVEVGEAAAGAAGGQGPVIAGLTVRRTRPDDADRPHAIEVAGYDKGAQAWRVDAEVASDEVHLTAADGRPVPAVVLPDAGSRTWATIRLSERTLDALPAELSLIGDDVARAVIWTALVDGVNDAVIDPRRIVDIAVAALPGEHNPSLLQGITGQVASLFRRFLPVAARPAARRRLDEACRAVAAETPRGSSHYLTAVRGRASWTDDEAYLRGLAEGDTKVEPLASDSDVRWLASQTLARLGLVDLAYLDARHAEDQTMAGNLAYLTARASLRGAADKAWAWDRITTHAAEHSNYELNALALGFWNVEDEAELRDYALRYFTDIPALSGVVGEDALSRVVAMSFPLGLIEQAVADRAHEALAGDDLSPAVRREIVDCLAALEQSLASRSRFGG